LNELSDKIWNRIEVKHEKRPSGWKGDEAKSGGIATNIGIHFFDMLSWIFGPVEENVVHIKQPDTNAGFMKLKNARNRAFC
jgi:UDP-N-acetyl-2-amino-2-deoxyglucuronate dehydrogenase